MITCLLLKSLKNCGLLINLLKTVCRVVVSKEKENNQRDIFHDILLRYNVIYDNNQKSIYIY